VMASARCLLEAISMLSTALDETNIIREKLCNECLHLLDMGTQSLSRERGKLRKCCRDLIELGADKENSQLLLMFFSM